MEPYSKQKKSVTPVQSVHSVGQHNQAFLKLMGFLFLFCCLFVVGCSQNCNQESTCGDCINNPGCGFCWSSQSCVSGTASGPTSGFCVDYSWFFNSSAPCPDDPVNGCAAANNCGSCVQKEACAWCKSKCVAIDENGGGSKDCASPDVATRSCGCQIHPSCINCQADPSGCQWCPQEQMCLPASGLAKCKGLTAIQCRDCSIYPV